MPKCPVCNAKIDKNTKFCPQCGNILDSGQTKKRRSMTFAEMLVGLIVVFIVLNSIGNVSDKTVVTENVETTKNVDITKNVAKINTENLKKEKLNKLKKAVKKIPERQYQNNLEIYTQLLKLEPTNEVYKNKISYYLNKVNTYKSQCIKSGNKVSWDIEKQVYECIDFSKMSKDEKYEYQLKKIMQAYAPKSIHTNLEICLQKLKHGNEWYYKGDYSEALYYFEMAPQYCEGTPYERAAYTHICDIIGDDGN